MVSFWPFGKKGADAASFERTLTALTGKINRATATQDRQRTLSRRARVMWTLYAGFAYILAAVLLTLVTGWQNWGVAEGTVVAGGPVIIYAIRYALTSYFEYRIKGTDAYLKKLNRERDAAIDRFKEATKFNSTQKLLEKYGASPEPKEPAVPPGKHLKSQSPQKQAQAAGPRTGIAPPPTANIQRPRDQHQPLPSTPQRPPANASSAQASLHKPPADLPGAEFAPNAFGASELVEQFSAIPATTFTQAHWYDRILDALLGEDETQPKNRFVLICHECRLVNGQAPPGARTLEDVGRWRCGGCHAWNGREKHRNDVVDSASGWEAEQTGSHKLRATSDGGIDSDNRETEDDGGIVVGTDEGSGVDVAAESAEERPARSKSTRSKTKSKGKK